MRFVLYNTRFVLYNTRLLYTNLYYLYIPMHPVCIYATCLSLSVGILRKQKRVHLIPCLCGVGCKKNLCPWNIWQSFYLSQHHSSLHNYKWAAKRRKTNLHKLISILYCLPIDPILLYVLWCLRTQLAERGSGVWVSSEYLYLSLCISPSQRRTSIAYNITVGMYLHGNVCVLRESGYLSLTCA